MVSRCLLLILLLATLGSAQAQETEPVSTPLTDGAVTQEEEEKNYQLLTEERSSEASSEKSPLELKRDALLRIKARQGVIQEKISATTAELRSATTDFEKNQLTKELGELQIESDDLDQEFSKVATGVNLSGAEGEEDRKVNLQDELKELLKPVLDELHQITEAPRQAEELKSQILRLERKRDLLRKARTSVEEVVSDQNTPLLSQALDEEQARITEDIASVETALSVARYELKERDEARVPFFQSVSNLVQNFFRTRGAHLLFAILGAVGVLLLLRFIYRSMVRLSPKKVRKGQNFAGRLLQLGFTVVSVIGAIIAFLLVLYLTNDWVLLALALLLLFGIIWAGKTALPNFIEQAKMILNLGPVRYRERLIYEGVPWQVRRINFYTDLTNPALEGGLIRLPMRDLMGMHSRPTTDQELWFPCQQDDWVQLSDGTFGKVLQQTPDYVHLVKLGGSRVVIPTADFLTLHPENLSRNYRIVVTFGIDYSYQDIATTKVPLVFESALKTALVEKLQKKELMLNLSVFFHSASASSLDYRIVLDLDGSLAPRRQALMDHVQSVCVDVCNRQGWSIPFTQITIHQAEGDEKTTLETGKPPLL